nr:MltA domain-containing protein [Chthonobacter albigriseus]
MPARLGRTDFGSLKGWTADDHAAAFAAFRRSAERILSHPPTTKPFGISAAALRPAAEAALARPVMLDRAEAKTFFETWFRPRRIRPLKGGGFVTGYYEPEVPGSRSRSDRFPVPIHARPEDLVEIPDEADRSDLDPALTWARRRPDGGLEPFPDRGAVMAGALDGRGLEIAFVESWVEAFFIHVQGSARIRLAEGGTLRVSFAGKSGHPYFPIARVLVEKGLMKPAEATADVLRRWLEENPDEASAVMARNRSYIMFREAPVPDEALGPVAAAGVPLTPGRSLAVDRNLHTFHVPVFVETVLDGATGAEALPFQRLMIAQDTGSAILGPARGDIFFGTGDAAWRQAARVRHPARFTLLVPRRGVRGP